MVDPERLLRLMAGIRHDVGVLRDLGGRVDEPAILDAVKYRFITAIEGAARVAHHVVVSEGWAAPDSSAAAFGELARHDVIPTGSATALGRAVGFRNLLVHQYATIDDARVVAMLDRLGDLDDFVSAVGSWLAGR